MSGSRDLITGDSLFDGRLTCRQYKNGYRFSIDAVLAASFARPEPGSTILDLGCGCGVIGLILTYLYPTVQVVGLEIQPQLARLAAANATANTLADRCRIIEGDLCAIEELCGPESFDLVVCNPPFRELRQGRVSPGDQRGRARHEIHCRLVDIVRAAAYGVKNRGRIVMVYPARRTAALLAALQGRRLEPKRLRPVYSYPDSPEATLVLVEAVKNGGEQLQLMAPLYIYLRKNGPWSAEIEAMYAGPP